jgi:hypothetical protein
VSKVQKGKKMKTKQLSRQRRIPGASMLITLSVITLFVCSRQSLAQQWETNGDNIRNINTGNVGIGTSSSTPPAAKLEVIGPGTYVARFRRTSNSNGGVLIDSPAGFNSNLALATGGSVKWYLLANNSNNDFLQFWDSSGAVPRFTLTQNGNLGIGIGAGTPLAKLHVSGVAPWGTAVFSGTSISSHFNYNENNSEDTYIRGGKATSHVIISDVNAGNVLVALGGGNVGIATGTPTAKLHVQGNGKFTGNLTVDGNIAAKYQDVAEWVPAEEQLSAGTVVVLDASKSNQVISSSKSYDTRVAGVVSAQPGITLGEAGDSKVLVATTGRVLVNVDATGGPIQIGDLLVTSNREGFAMQSLPVEIGGVRIHRPGTLIGKALEPLTSGTGKILVLLSLQ